MMPQLVISPQHVAFRRIALLTDLDGDADRKLRFAASLARLYGSELLLAHAFAPEIGVHIPPEPLPNWPASGLPAREDAEEKARRLIAGAGAEDVISGVIIAESHIPGLLQEVEKRMPDLLVLATHGRTGIRKWLAGSVCEEVFRRARTPVLILPPHYLPVWQGASRPQKILYATDLSEISSTALQYAAGIADDERGKLTALYVDSRHNRSFSFDHVIDQEKLADWLHSHRHDYSRALREASRVVRFGTPAVEVRQAAVESEADLIVVGARGAGAASGLTSHFLGGTSYEVAATAPCPVLIVPYVS
jgi:nucleotide-binding universal stress UspA family protein